MIRIRGGNIENTHTINVASASAMDQEKGNDWHIVSVVKLKHTTCYRKPCVTVLMISNGNPCAVFPYTVY
jgi:hypothetical protein